MSLVSYANGDLEKIYGNIICTDSAGIYHGGSQKISLIAEDGLNFIQAGFNRIYNSAIEINGIGTVKLDAKYNIIDGGASGIAAGRNATIEVKAAENNYIRGNERAAVLVTGASNITITGKQNFIVGEHSEGVISDIGSVCVTGDNDNKIISKYASGVLVSGNGYVNISSKEHNNIISGIGQGVRVENSANKDTIISAKLNNEITSDSRGVYVTSGMITIESQDGENIVSGISDGIWADNSSTITLKSGNSNNIQAKSSYGLFGYTSSNIDLIAVTNKIYSDQYGIGAQSNSVIKLDTLNSELGNNYIESSSYAVFAASNSLVQLTANNGTNIVNSGYGIYTQDFGTKTELSARDNFISVNNYGLWAVGKSIITLKAFEEDNSVIASESSGFGQGYSIYTTGESSVTLEAGSQNALLGAVYAKDNGTSVTLSGLNGVASKSNVISSYAQISNAGGLSSESGKVISALYAEQGAKIELKGEVNDIGTYADNTDTSTLERTVWAYNGYASDYTGERVGSQISINGDVQIKTDRYVISPDSLDVAIAAGTGVDLTHDKVFNTALEDDERAQVNITYSNVTDKWSENTETSYDIEGDILSAYEGLINIDTDDPDAGINIHGNLLAGNNGILNVNLGKNGVLTGRADDYGDAGYVDEEHSTNETFADPAFSSNIFKGGVVNLKMGEGSRWNVTGQSWITTIKTSDAAISDDTPIIDLITANSDRSTKAHALTVYELNGNAVFNMSLDGNRSTSDMLYIKNAQGEYTVNVKDAVSVADMYANNHTGLRFATLGADSHANFRAITWDGGVNNIEYEVDTDDYDTSTENTAYNGESLSAGKPGDTTVDTFFSSNGKPGSTTSGENGDESIGTQSLADDAKIATATAENAGIETEASSTPNTNATNYKLVSVKSSEISDGGKTVIDMSRANYANAVYMDTLNKRQGEARFVSDTDHGVWVRLRHDNIGKEDAFRSHNTMVEVGIDQRDVHDYGEFHTGVALDYMNGSLDYHTVDGDGDIERYGIWFYTTYLGNDGQYADLILKYGHLKNDFGFNTKTQGEHVTGDYTNETASISAEYGWKFSNSHNYYIEPQAQLQYTYITGADYTTSQGSMVDLDSIHSLIGRVGFRAGKDFLDWEHPASFYLRADALHEFLGDQDIYAYDDTGVMDVTYKNDDTWYSAGVGLSVQSSENTYFFIEGEQVFGADNDSTYTVSGGFKHSF